MRLREIFQTRSDDCQVTWENVSGESSARTLFFNRKRPAERSFLSIRLHFSTLFVGFIFNKVLITIFLCVLIPYLFFHTFLLVE